MKSVNIGLVGFGTVGRGVAWALLTKKKILEARAGVSLNLVRIADLDTRKRRGIRVPKGILTKSADSVVKDKNIDIVVELIGGIHPAKEIILKALTSGKSVVTANKALLAEHGREIFTVASRFKVLVGFEASVGGGIPIINSLRRSFIANEIELIYGILNGTSNFILSKMSDEGSTFIQALRDAQKKGIAEKNPSLDISGMDSCHKLALLALLGFGVIVRPKDIYVEGIERIDPIDMENAKKWGYAIKSLAIAKRVGKELDLRVHPTLISLKTLLANVKYEDNAIFTRGDMVGDSLLYGKGAGSLPTASSVVGDIVEIAEGLNDYRKSTRPFSIGFPGGVKTLRKISDLVARYYLRFSAIDKPGVLAQIANVFSENKISISTVTQREKKLGQPVPIIMLTHEINEGDMNRAFQKIDKLPSITEKSVKIRIEG